jgi:cell division protein ZapA (FtsZ GTPase activity inhibitor)
MKQEFRKYIVTILQEPYTLIGDEPEGDVLEASRRVDAIMQEISSKAPQSANHHKAVLAALQLALKLIALEAEQKNTLHMVKKCLDALEEPTNI